MMRKVRRCKIRFIVIEKEEDGDVAAELFVSDILLSTLIKITGVMFCSDKI